jgi:hypothetical protein
MHDRATTNCQKSALTERHQGTYEESIADKDWQHMEYGRHVVGGGAGNQRLRNASSDCRNHGVAGSPHCKAKVHRAGGKHDHSVRQGQSTSKTCSGATLLPKKNDASDSAHEIQGYLTSLSKSDAVR